MPNTLTLTNLSDELVERLRARAARHQRNPSEEAANCLEEAVLGHRKPPLAPEEVEALLVRLRKYRGLLPVDFKFDRDEANSHGG